MLRIMKSLIIFAFLIGITKGTYYPPLPSWSYNQAGSYYGYTYEVPCNNVITNEVVLGFRQSMYDTLIELFHRTVALSDAHFTFSPYTIWRCLSAVAEGSEGQTKVELYRLLRLPQDKCVRQMYYELAANLEGLSDDVILERNRLFIADSSVILNRNWENYVRTHKLIDIAQTPYKINPIAEAQSWRQTFDAQLPNLNLNGNSVILESLDYNGLWTTAFPEVSVVKEPFYDAFGKQVANIEYMKMKKRVNIVYLPTRNMKIMELPVGKGGRYRMLFALVTGPFRSTVSVIKSSIIFEALANMKKTPKPIDIVIPRIAMTSEVDVRRMLEDVGVRAMWSDSYGTRNISEPAALPSSYIQRVSVTLDNKGVMPSVQEYSNFIPSIPFESTLHSNTTVPINDFIANRPFLFGIFDSETYMCLFASSFSKPTY